MRDRATLLPPCEPGRSTGRGDVVRVEAATFRRGDAGGARPRVRVGGEAGRFDVGTGPVLGMSGGRGRMMRTRREGPDAGFDAAVVAGTPRRRYSSTVPTAVAQSCRA